MNNGRHSETTPEAPVPPFDTWLDQATRGLCDFAKTQVREEYEDHFTAAYEQLRAEGLGETEAAETAVQSLGDARAIRRQLRKVYLTRGEDATLGSMASLSLPHIPASPLSRGAKLGFAALVALPLLFMGAFIGASLGGGTGLLIGLVLGTCFAAAMLSSDWLVYLWIRFVMQTEQPHPEEDLVRYLKRRSRQTLLFLLVMASLPLLFMLDASTRMTRESYLALAMIMVNMALFGLLAVSYGRYMRAIMGKLQQYPEQNATSSVLNLHSRIEQMQNRQGLRK